MCSVDSCKRDDNTFLKSRSGYAFYRRRRGEGLTKLSRINSGKKKLTKEAGMRRKRTFWLLALSAVFLIMLSNAVLCKRKPGQGLSTKFSDIILGNLKPGMVYSLKKERGLPYKVMNTGDTKRTLEIKVEKPGGGQLKPGYEPIPDPAWIRIIPERFELAPGEESNCDIIISIPQDEKFANRHFQALLVTMPVFFPDEPGVHLAFAIASRFRFSTGPTPVEVLVENRRKILEALKIEIAPFNLHVSEIPTGKVIRLGKGEYPTLQLVNRGKESYKLKFGIADDPSRYGLAKDYIAAPDKTWLKILRKTMKVKQRQIKDIGMELNIPDKEEYKGKFFAFVVIGEIEGLDFPVRIYSRLYIKTKE